MERLHVLAVNIDELLLHHQRLLQQLQIVRAILEKALAKAKELARVNCRSPDSRIVGSFRRAAVVTVRAAKAEATGRIRAPKAVGRDARALGGARSAEQAERRRARGDAWGAQSVVRQRRHRRRSERHRVDCLVGGRGCDVGGVVRRAVRGTQAERRGRLVDSGRAGHAYCSCGRPVPGG
eukprot:scaffold285311_cov31-Tisochrysis_lutea.AAC.2